MEMANLFAVMVSRLQEVNSVIAHEIDNAMFLRQPARPTTRAKIFERFGLPDSFKRIAQDGFHQFESSQSQFAICLDPITQVFDELRLEDCLTLFRFQAPPRGAGLPCLALCLDFSMPVQAQIEAAPR